MTDKPHDNIRPVTEQRRVSDNCLSELRTIAEKSVDPNWVRALDDYDDARAALQRTSDELAEEQERSNSHLATARKAVAKCGELGKRVVELEALKKEWDAGEWDSVYTKYSALRVRIERAVDLQTGILERMAINEEEQGRTHRARGIHEYALTALRILLNDAAADEAQVPGGECPWPLHDAAVQGQAQAPGDEDDMRALQFPPLNGGPVDRPAPASTYTEIDPGGEYVDVCEECEDVHDLRLACPASTCPECAGPPDHPAKSSKCKRIKAQKKGREQ